MILYVKLILAHLLGDFLLQPSSWVKAKKEKKIHSPELYYHTLIHGGLIMLLLWDIKYGLLALVMMTIHLAIDLLKIYAQNPSNATAWFLTDQALHLLSILIIGAIWSEPEFSFFKWLDRPQIWIYITALFFLTYVTGIAIQIMMTNWANAIDDDNNESLKDAGRYIGILERLFIFTFIVTGNLSAIGFLLAAKSIFRFGDLKDAKGRKLTEYILIGTLLSFGVATATGLLVLYFISGL